MLPYFETISFNGKHQFQKVLHTFLGEIKFISIFSSFVIYNRTVNPCTICCLTP